MKDPYENLNKTFNIESDIQSTEKIESNKITKDDNSEISIKGEVLDIKKTDSRADYDYARGNLYSIIEKGQEAINGVLELAQETESPRAYEVFGQLIKNVSDTTEKLIDLQKKMKDLEETKTPSSPTTVNNTLFVGTTAELSKLLKNKLNSEETK